MHYVPLFILLSVISVAVGSKLIKQRRRERELHRVLTKNFRYYSALSVSQRERFRQRVTYFLTEKEFHGRGIEVTNEMQIMVAACAVQLTFGLPPLALAHFTRIVIYADHYRSRLTGSEHVGEVNPGMKAIVVSWKKFVADYAVPDDARNLGLHEMAHALWFENRIQNEEYDFLSKKLMAEWRRLAHEEAARINSGHSRLFRDYAATNQEEFSAVAVEYFFERPADFKEDMPEMYKVLSALLAQDPALSVSKQRSAVAVA